MKNYILKSIFIALAIVGGLMPSYATHIVGGDITYKYLGNDSYEITLTLRRDCNLGQVNFDDPASIGLFDPSSNDLIREIRLPFLASDTVGNTIVANCGFVGSQVCVQRTSYRSIVSLPARQGGYIVAYQRCCRNASLSNVVTPLESGSTQWVHITDSALSLKNNSPTFNTWPDVYICANTPLVFNHAATDADGDSLVYRTCVPFDGATFSNPQPTPPNKPPYLPISWKAPYDLNNMMGGTALVIDPKTGVITANPDQVGQFLIGICVEEYRNGQLISTIKRDFQYNVRICLPPAIASFTSEYNMCEVKEVSFTNSTQNANSFEWNFNFPSTDPANKSNLENPSFAYTQPGTYIVRLSAKSTSGACDGIAYDTIVVAAPPTQFILSNGPTNTCGGIATYTVTGGYPNGIVNWYSDANLTIFLGTGPSIDFNTSDASNSILYAVSTVAGIDCGNIVTNVTINDRSFDATYDKEINLCAGVEKSINITTNSTSPVTFAFNDPHVVSAAINTIIIKSLISDNAPYTITGIATNEFGCSEEIIINVSPSAGVGSAFTSIIESCADLKMCFKLENTNISNFIWDFGIPGSNDTSTDANPCFSYDQSGTYTVTLSSTDMLCPFTPITQSVTVPQKSQAPTLASTLKDCATNEFCFTSTGGNVLGDVLWSFGDPNSGVNNTSMNVAPCHKFSTPGQYTVTLSNTNTACPFAPITLSVTVPAKSIAPSVSSTLKDCNTNEFCFASTGGSVLGDVVWNFGDPNSGINNTSTAVNPCHKYSAPGEYTVTLTNINTACPFVLVTIKVTVDPPLKLIPFQDITACLGIAILITGPPIPGITYQWCNEKGEVVGTGINLTLTPSENTKYTLKIKNTAGCTDSASVNIKVFKFDYNIESPSVICAGENFLVKANVANPSDYIFSWGPPECIVNGGNAAQAIVVAADKTITLTLTSKSTGCIDTRSITTKVEPAAVATFSGNYCNGQNSTMSVNVANPENYTYEWSPANMIISGANTANPVVNLTSDKQFTVVITNKTTKCETILSYNAIVNPLLSVVFENSPVEINQGRDGDLVIKNPITGSTYKWSTNETGTTINVGPITNTSYTVTVTDVNGCTGTGVVNVVVRTVNCTEKDEYLPNAFSPNNDGKNDILFVKSNVIDKLEFVIYNRWGQEMFNTTDITKGWDGTCDGKDLKPDAYAYYIKGTCLNGDSFIKKGNVSLLR